MGFETAFASNAKMNLETIEYLLEYLSPAPDAVADLEIQNGGFSHWRAKRVRKFLGCHAHFRSRWKSELNISKQL